ncbi:MAG: superoxide dismutase family protein [Pseudomonadota bacterium]
MTTAHVVVAPINSGTITGTAAFMNVTNGVQVIITLANCPAGDHGIHIHEGTACTNSTTQGGHWGGTGTAAMPTRGEGIGGVGTGVITCGFNGTAGLTYTRTNADPATAWTIGGDAATNVIGHPLIVHGLTSTDREGCGVIQAN